MPRSPRPAPGGPAPRRSVAVLRAVAALVLLAAVLVGLPLLLAATAGNPLDSWPDLAAGDVSDTVLVDVLAAVAYLAWAQFALAVAAEVATALLRLRRPLRLPVVLPAQQHLAHSLVAAVLAIGPLATPPAVGGTGPHPIPDVVAAAVVTPTAASPAGPVTGAPTPVAAPEPGQEYVVTAEGPGTLWDLARVHLGAGERWQEIWALNRGRQQADGHVMTDPGLLRVGWTVALPGPDGTRPPGQPQTDRPAGVLVERGDTLSGIAAAHDIADWHRLWQANAGRPQPGGRHFTDPDHIEPGWTIDLRPTPATPAGSRPGDEAPDPAAGHPSPVIDPSPPPDPPAPTAATDPTPATPAPGVLGPQPSSGAHPSPRATTPAMTASATTPARQPDPADDGGPDLDRAALAAAGLASGLLGGMVLLALRRGHRRRRRHRRPGRAVAPTPISAVPTERAVLTASTEDIHWLDEVLRGLAHALAQDPGGRLPDLIAAALTAQGAELVLAQPVPDAPGSWTVHDGGSRWRLARDADTGYDHRLRAVHATPYPALTGVGHDGRRDDVAARPGTPRRADPDRRCPALPRPGPVHGRRAVPEPLARTGLPHRRRAR